eukprot:4029215-Pleurochrysis_carterae.AAC.2
MSQSTFNSPPPRPNEWKLAIGVTGNERELVARERSLERRRQGAEKGAPGAARPRARAQQPFVSPAEAFLPSPWPQFPEEQRHIGILCKERRTSVLPTTKPVAGHMHLLQVCRRVADAVPPACVGRMLSARE